MDKAALLLFLIFNYLAPGFHIKPWWLPTLLVVDLGILAIAGAM
jgi:hypothetical protein